jgi:hypothetical protein
VQATAATVTVTGKGNYAGTARAAFSITASQACGGVTWDDEADVSSELPWTGCEAVGEDWRRRLLPEKYFTKCDGEEMGS